MSDDTPTGQDPKLQLAAPPSARLREAGPAAVAMVRGEAVTDLPTDLYIPPDALQVFLETFEGPLDLLLYLIRRENLDIARRRQAGLAGAAMLIAAAVLVGLEASPAWMGWLIGTGGLLLMFRPHR